MDVKKKKSTTPSSLVNGWHCVFGDEERRTAEALTSLAGCSDRIVLHEEARQLSAQVAPLMGIVLPCSAEPSPKALFTGRLVTTPVGCTSALATRGMEGIADHNRGQASPISAHFSQSTNDKISLENEKGMRNLFDH